VCWWESTGNEQIHKLWKIAYLSATNSASSALSLIKTTTEKKPATQSMSVPWQPKTVVHSSTQKDVLSSDHPTPGDNIAALQLMNSMDKCPASRIE
jgi:hypothetical protein